MVDSGGTNIDKGFTTPQGTYVGENKSALSQLAPVVSATGDGAVVAGSLMVLTGIGAPLGAGLIVYGGYASTLGTGMELADDKNKGTLTTEKVVTKGVLMAVPAIGGAALGTQATDFVNLLNLQTMAIDKTIDALRESKN